MFLGITLFLLFKGSGSLKVLLDNWNIATVRWLRYSVYERLYSTTAVFTVSAFWHGFYPGYYLMFFSFAMATPAARLVSQMHLFKIKLVLSITVIYIVNNNVFICLDIFMPLPRSRDPRLSVRSRTPAVCRHLFVLLNMVQQIEFIIYKTIQPLRQKFFTKGQAHRLMVKVKDSKKCFVNAILLHLSNFFCEVTHEYGDDLIRFSAFHR